MAQEAQAQHTTPDTMAPRGQAAKAERMARAEAIAEKSLALEAAALKKAAAEPVLQTAAACRPTIPAYAPYMDTMMTSDTQVDYDVNDTQDHAPLTDLAGVVMDDDKALQATAMGADDTAGEDGKQRSPEQQSQETQAQEACHPLSPPHHTNLQI